MEYRIQNTGDFFIYDLRFAIDDWLFLRVFVSLWQDICLELLKLFKNCQKLTKTFKNRLNTCQNSYLVSGFSYLGGKLSCLCLLHLKKQSQFAGLGPETRNPKPMDSEENIENEPNVNDRIQNTGGRIQKKKI